MRYSILNSWLHRMTDFNKICYRVVMEFSTLENIQLLSCFKQHNYRSAWNADVF